MITKEQVWSRRRFVIQTSAMSAAALFTAKLRSQSLVRGSDAISADTPLKFNPDGSPRAFAGNTVICHLPAQSAIRDAITDLHGELARSSFRTKLGLTPPESYHMTVFSGPTDQRRSSAEWPSYVPLDAPIGACNRLVAEHMRQARLRCELPLRMTLDKEATVKSNACSLRLQPANENESQKLRTIRQEIGQAYGYRTPDSENYTFHVTVSYQLAPFSQSEQSSYIELLRTHLARIVDAADVLELGNPEYCTFKDMFRFEPQILLACS